MREELEDHGVEPDFTPVYTVMGLPLGIALDVAWRMEHGVEPDFTPVDTFMGLPLGIALDLAWCMEHGDDPCEE